MNLYLRLIGVIIGALIRPKICFDGNHSITLRILPNDLDINNHLNNGRYLTLLDLASMDLFLRSGILKKAIFKGLRPIVGGVIVTYRKGLSLFERCTLSIRLEASDTRWHYFRFVFLNSRNELSAIGYFKGAFISKNGFCPSDEVFNLVGHHPHEYGFSKALSLWIKSEKEIILDN